ncbi:MAG TPA: hypothetical protein VKO43_07440 [Candidatus Krumholzibacteriaceae bacterium]|nr:hypothetical protein [Candidatus Krumholzibacteriaceae bacterium]
MSGQSIARKFLTLITFLSVLAAIGCGDYSPVSPSQENNDVSGVENPLFVQLLSTSEGSSRPIVGTASKVISAEKGGTVDNGYFSLSFPPGALDEDTEITIEMPQFPSAVVELGPHGIQFNKDVTLSLSTDLIESESAEIKVVWFNEETGIWEYIGESTEGGVVKADLEHFSDYAYLGGG